MAGRKAPWSTSTRALSALSPHLTLGGLALLAAAPLMLAIALVPPAAVLPTISFAALGLAALVAGFAWWRKANRHGQTVTLWDVAGACVLVGCAAAMLTEPDNLMQVFGQTEQR